MVPLEAQPEDGLRPQLPMTRTSSTGSLVVHSKVDFQPLPRAHAASLATLTLVASKVTMTYDNKGQRQGKEQ
jgi:hypothetical protein